MSLCCATGQVVDAVATPLVGIMSDKWGSRKTWHLAGRGASKCAVGPKYGAVHSQTDRVLRPPGTVLVLVSFPLVFSECGVCWMAPTQTWVAPLYYALLIAAFQTGWATVQIAHLSLIPDLTPRQPERAELTAIRYTASVCSSLALYVITWVVFHVTRGEVGINKIGPGDVFKFRVSASTRFEAVSSGQTQALIGPMSDGRASCSWASPSARCAPSGSGTV